MPGELTAAAEWYAAGRLLPIFMAVVAVAGVTGTWIGIRRSNPKRRLLYGMRTVAPIPGDELKDELTIRHDGQDLIEPRFLVVELVGRGRRDIPIDLFGGVPIRLTIGGRIVKILKVTTNEPQRSPPKVNDDGAALLIGPSVIGKQQRVSVALLTAEAEPHLHGQAPFADVDFRPATTDELIRSRTSRALRVAAILLTGVLLGFTSLLTTPLGRQYAFGTDRPIELSPLCAHLGGIVAPPAERNAAYHYRCVQSTNPISRDQIAQRCKVQWGFNAKLLLHDRNSAAGWKCHVRGLLH
jgi:hypothetical protein